MTVFIVTAGSYSDFHVVCCCSDEDKAKELAAILDDGGYESYELDDFPANVQGMQRYHVKMRKNGDTHEIFSSKPSSLSLNELDMSECVYDDLLHVTCWAKDEKHAVKIANEIRTCRIAENNWKEE